ncbi:hypothetical protein CFter6_1300 [Collimonas fungivorans]|uniref:Transposase n=1 Tax=Collimonas fungivorans TaxID=158899 RepID=A0A127P868_9BURK|nr:hypothetical protein CFter6_1300 [Collimonas fungivorans]
MERSAAAIRLVEATRVYDFDPEDYEPTEVVTALTRAFILSHVSNIRCPRCGVAALRVRNISGVI